MNYSSNETKTVLFSESCTVPKEYEKYDHLVDSIININKETIQHVFEEITPDLVNFAKGTIEYACQIRITQLRNLCILFLLLLKRYGAKKIKVKTEPIIYLLRNCLEADIALKLK